MGSRGRLEARSWFRRNAYLLLGAGVWSAIIGASFGVSLVLDRKAIADLALGGAQMACRALTVLHSPLMARQVHGLGGVGEGIQGHFTSLNPISPKNQPDDWEKKALHRLAAGVPEASDVTDIDGRSHLRLLRPLRIEQDCLQCHAGQGYKAGDIRGGVSVSVPLAPLWDAHRPHVRTTLLRYGAIWLFGLGAVALAALSFQRRKLERQQSDTAFRDLFDNAPVAYHEIDRNAVIRRVNRAGCELLGFEAGQMLGRPVWEFAAETDRQASREAFRRKLAGELLGTPFQRRFIRRDGGELLLEIHGSLVRNAAGETAGFRCALLDITTRKRAEEALRESEERYRRIVETAQEGIWIIDAEGKVTYANQRIAEMLDYPLAEIVGRPVAGFIAEEHRELSRQNLARRRQGAIDLYEFTFLRRSGSPLHTLVSANPLYDGAGGYAGALGMLTDITGRKQAEERLMQTQKMESIGRLAGGVAHDFNNLLTVINGYSQLLLGKLSASDPLRAGLAEILKAGERAARLTEQLLAFSRKQVLQPRVLDLNHVVSGMRSMLARLVGEDVEVRAELNAENAKVHADPHQLEQVVMNLVVNSRDAMPHGGKLLLETACAGRYVLLAVSDTGTGMDEETRLHIFEPFFTTKGVGKGTGLGLSMVEGIVAQSGGSIEVYSEPGRGTTFKIYLPRLEEERAEAKVEAVPALGGTETVLVVEDQAEVREYAATVLGAYGYRVVKAESAGQALALCEQQRFDLLLTDVVMPNIGGRELANRLEKLRPGIKVLFMSGYTDDVIVHHGVLEEQAQFIQKPFSPEQLAAKVREALEGGL